MKRMILMLTAILPLVAFAQSVTVTRSLEMLPNSQAVVQFNNIFGNWENREVDDSFPYVVIQMNLAGDANAVGMAKQKIGLEVGTMFQVTATDKNQPNKILFLVPRGVRNIYVVCGDGCEKQLLHSGTLVENKVYECMVAFKTNAPIANGDIESFKKQNEQMNKQMEDIKKQNEQMQQLLLSMQQNQGATVNNSPYQSVIEVAKGITINLNNPEDARFYAMSGSELKSYASKCEGTTKARVLAIGAYKGDLDCQTYLGVCYYEGDGVTQDYSEAVKWYRKAAEQGNRDAQYKLGNCYAFSRGVTQNYYEAVKWYRKVAEQGNVYAQYHLGYCYEYGKGVSKDISEAVKWYRKAAEQGLENAEKALSRLGY